MSAIGCDFRLKCYQKYPRIDLCFNFLHNLRLPDPINLKDIHVLFKTVHTHTEAIPGGL
jgi:hypothetical protein